MVQNAQPPGGFTNVDPSDVDTQVLHGGSPPVPSVSSSRRTEGPPQRGHTLGRYVILSPLGSGAMGAVYSAYDPELNRIVAIKVMNGEYASAPIGRQRLLREAQALARLSHPNVVAVHDVGSLPDGIFVAMEYVAGKTLHAWLRESEPSQGEILAAFRGAGAGLAAAHAAGVVHRDFKPGNVLIGQDGRPRVVDFGLARRASGTDDARPELSSVPAAEAALDLELTFPGEVLGTPRYMAPEQVRGGEVGAAADQFAFCVALYTALYGEPPFDDALQPPMLQLALKDWRVRDAPKASQVPSHLRRIFLRGLSVEPGDRFPSMDALLDALDHDPARARRLWAAGGFAVALTAAGLALSARSPDRAALCSGADRHLADVWDGPRRDVVRGALLASPLPFVRDTWARLEPLLNDYASKWATTHVEACRATRVRGEQSEHALDLRMGCLRQRRDDLKALTDLLVANPSGAAERAVQAAYALSDLRACDDVQALAQPVPPPADAGARAKVEALSEELSAVRALYVDGRYKEGLARAERALVEARDVGHKPSEARAGEYVGYLRRKCGDRKGAEGAQMEAVAAAVAGRDGQWLSLAAQELGWNVGVDQRRFDEGLAWAQIAMAAAEWQGQADGLSAKIVSLEGSIFLEQQNYDEARRRFTRALDLHRRTTGLESITAVSTLYNLGLLDMRTARYEEANARMVDVLRWRERALGPRHPETGVALGFVGATEFCLKRYDDSSASTTRALAILEAALGKDHGKTALVVANLSEIDLFLGRDAEAISLANRALAFYEKAQDGEKHLVHVHLSLGRAHLRAGKADDAVRELERAQSILKARGAHETISRPNVELTLARALYLAGSRERARQIVERLRSEVPADVVALAEKSLTELNLAGPPVVGPLARFRRRGAPASRE